MTNGGSGKTNANFNCRHGTVRFWFRPRWSSANVPGGTGPQTFSRLFEVGRYEAEAWFARLPAADVGCLYLGPDGNPFTPDPADPGFPEVPRHLGSVRGAWPELS